MPSITLEIPGEVTQALRLPPPEVAQRLRLELAIYAQQILGLGKSAELAGLSRLEFNEVLARRQVPMHYGDAELTEDLAYARGRQ
jgi:predicted HTH domain antitoxin